MTEFADLSVWQRGTDLAAYARAGHDRVALKATEGGSGPGEPYVNPEFPGWWRAAGQLGLSRLAYHYDDGDAPAAQAVHFLGTVGARGPRDVLAVDAEAPGNPTAAAGRHVAALVAELANRGAPAGMVYARANWLAAAQLLPAMLPAGWRWLWLAEYGVKTPRIPPGWSADQILAWQFTDRASTAGVPAPCDRSRVLREWLPEGDDMPTAAEIVDELERRVLAGMRLAETPKVGLATDNPWTVLGRTYIKTGDIQAPLLKDLAANVGDGRRELSALRAGLALLVPQDHPVAQALAGVADPRVTALDLLGQLDTAGLLEVASAALSRLQATPTTTSPTGGS